MISKYVDKTEEDLCKQFYIDKDLIIKDIRCKKISFFLKDFRRAFRKRLAFRENNLSKILKVGYCQACLQLKAAWADATAPWKACSGKLDGKVYKEPSFGI